MKKKINSNFDVKTYENAVTAKFTPNCPILFFNNIQNVFEEQQFEGTIAIISFHVE